MNGFTVVLVVAAALSVLGVLLIVVTDGPWGALMGAGLIVVGGGVLLRTYSRR